MYFIFNESENTFILTPNSNDRFNQFNVDIYSFEGDVNFFINKKQISINKNSIYIVEKDYYYYNPNVIYGQKYTISYEKIISDVKKEKFIIKFYSIESSGLKISDDEIYYYKLIFEEDESKILKDNKFGEILITKNKIKFLDFDQNFDFEDGFFAPKPFFIVINEEKKSMIVTDNIDQYKKKGLKFYIFKKFLNEKTTKINMLNELIFKGNRDGVYKFETIGFEFSLKKDEEKVFDLEDLGIILA